MLSSISTPLVLSTTRASASFLFGGCLCVLRLGADRPPDVAIALDGGPVDHELCLGLDDLLPCYGDARCELATAGLIGVHHCTGALDSSRKHECQRQRHGEPAH